MSFSQSSTNLEAVRHLLTLPFIISNILKLICSVLKNPLINWHVADVGKQRAPSTSFKHDLPKTE